MLVVPVKGDKVTTKDDSTPVVVSSYTSLKEEPAVYLTPSSSRDRFVFFSDIVEINGVRVEYQSDSNVFDALGPLKRAFNLPQPKDAISVKLIDVDYRDDVEEIEIAKLRLQSKRLGISRGLLVCGKESCFSLADVLGIDRRVGSEKFDAKKFQRYYLDYLPLKR